LLNTDRLRRWVDPAAGLPVKVRAHAPSASRTVAGSASALTGSEARATQQCVGFVDEAK